MSPQTVLFTQKPAGAARFGYYWGFVRGAQEQFTGAPPSDIRDTSVRFRA